MRYSRLNFLFILILNGPKNYSIFIISLSNLLFWCLKNFTESLQTCVYKIIFLFLNFDEFLLQNYMNMLRFFMWIHSNFLIIFSLLMVIIFRFSFWLGKTRLYLKLKMIGLSSIKYDSFSNPGISFFYFFKVFFLYLFLFIILTSCKDTFAISIFTFINDICEIYLR